MASEKFLSTINEPNTVITPIDSAIRFPEILDILAGRYITFRCDTIGRRCEGKSSRPPTMLSVRTSELGAIRPGLVLPSRDTVAKLPGKGDRISSRDRRPG